MTDNAEKQQWIQCYTCRIIAALEKWQSPLGIDTEYSKQLKEELADFYDDPLKKDLIETTY